MTQIERVVKGARDATPSSALRRCDTIKLREGPKALTTARAPKGGRCTGLTALGMVRTLRDATMDNLQPIPTGSKPTEAVQRLDDGGFGAPAPGLKI